MRRARLSAAGLALLAGAISAAPAASPPPQDAADPVLEAEFVLTGREHHSQGAAEVRVRGDGSVTVSVDTIGPMHHFIGPKHHPPAHVEQYRLSAEERRALASLVRQVDFFEASDPEPPGGRFDGPTLRISLDGRNLARENVDWRAFAPLTNWFHNWIHQTRLLARLRRDGDVRELFWELNPRNERIPQRHAFREPLREFAGKATDPELLAVALGALAPLEDAGPWAELASRRASALGEDGRLLLLSKLLGGSQWTDERVGEEHRAALLSDAFEAARPRTKGWADLTKEHRNATERLLQFLARRRYEPMFAAIPEIVRESPGDRRAVSLHDLTRWGERGFDAVLALTADADPAMRRAAVGALQGFLYTGADRPGEEHPVPAEERARVRARLLAEGLARLDALSEDRAEGREGRRLARGEAAGLRQRGGLGPAPKPRLPSGVSLEVTGEDGQPVPGVRVKGVRTGLRGMVDRDYRPTALEVSDASGMALFAKLESGDWEFDLEDSALVRKTVTATYIEGTAVALRLSVRARRLLSGRLVGNSGRPVVGAAVRRMPAGGTLREEDAEARADEFGRVSVLESPSRDRGRLQVRLADGRTFTLEERFLSDGKDWVVDFGPEGDGMEEPSIRGRVVGPAGEGLPATVVAVTADPPPGSTSSPAWTRTDGTFEMYGLAPGVYRLWATHRGPGKSVRGGASGFADVAEVPARGVTITIPIGGRIAGQVVDASGKAVAGLVVLARLRPPAAGYAPAEHGPPAGPPVGVRQGHAKTDRDGRFVIDDLAEGEYEFSSARGAPYWLDRRIAVRPGGSLTTLQAIKSEPLAGTVATKDGVALRGVEVVANRLPDRDHQCEGTTDESGAFSLVGADPESSYELNVNFGEGVPSEPMARSAPGARSVTLVAEPGALGSVVVKDRFGDRVPRMKILLRHAQSGRRFVRECDGSGEFHLPYRLTGRWTVERMDPNSERETVLGTVESGVPGQVISLPEEHE